MSGRAVGLFIIVCLLLYPYAALVSELRGWSFPLEEGLGVLAFTFVQASLSSLISVSAGVLGAFGLAWCTSRLNVKIFKALEIAVLVPNAAPVLILVLAVMRYLPAVRGIPGIIFVHVLMNTGLVAVAVFGLFRSKVGGMAELAYVEGATRLRFLYSGVVKNLSSELTAIAVFVFAVSFASFSVPLIIGGARATTMEILIYQKIRTFGKWDQAISLAFVQMAAIFTFAWFLHSRRVSLISDPRSLPSSPLLQSAWGLPMLIGAPLFLVLGLVGGLTKGFGKLTELSDARDLLFGSTAIGFGTGALVGCFLLLIAFVNPQGSLRRSLRGYAAPSGVLTGFALLFYWRATGAATFAKISLGLTLITVPSFYRMYLDAVVSAVWSQRSVAKTMGATDMMIFREVVFPQIARPVFRLSGLAAVWAWGDYGLSSVVAERTVTLAMLAQSLMASYRFDAATALVWILIAGAGTTFLFFDGVGRVLGSPSQT